MCGGGGNASNEAQRAEEARQARIASTQRGINTVFNDPRRQAEIMEVVAAVRQQQMGLLDEQKLENSRQLKFNTARGGLAGGNVQRDLNAQQKRDYDRSALGIEQKSQGVGANLQAADQDARARLISLATSGLDSTTAAQQSAAALRTNLQAGRADALSGGLADSFSSFKDTYGKMRDDYQRRQGLLASGVSPYGKLG